MIVMCLFFLFRSSYVLLLLAEWLCRIVGERCGFLFYREIESAH